MACSLHDLTNNIFIHVSMNLHLFKLFIFIFLCIFQFGCSGDTSSSGGGGSSSGGGGSVPSIEILPSFYTGPVEPTCSTIAVGAIGSRQNKGDVFIFNNVDFDNLTVLTPDTVLGAPFDVDYSRLQDDIQFGNALAITPDTLTLVSGALHFSTAAWGGVFYNQMDPHTGLWQQWFVDQTTSGLGSVGFSLAVSSDGYVLWGGAKNDGRAGGSYNDSTNSPYMYLGDYQYDVENKNFKEGNGPKMGFFDDNPENSIGWAYKLSYDNKYLIVSSPPYSQGNSSLGTVFIYSHQNLLNTYRNSDGFLVTLPAAIQKIPYSPPNQDMQYGVSLDLSSDNKWLVVGQSAKENRDGTTISSSIIGAVRIYEGDLSSQQWVFSQDFSGNSGDWNFSRSLSLSPDGTWLAVGAASGDRVYLYKNTGGTWTAEGTVKGVDTQSGDNFGQSLFLWMDDSSGTQLGTLLVGANKKDNSKGKVYVFTYDGLTWTQSGVIQPTSLLDNDQFGYALTCNVDTN